jgi:hypothetical protein
MRWQAGFNPDIRLSRSDISLTLTEPTADRPSLQRTGWADIRASLGMVTGIGRNSSGDDHRHLDCPQPVGLYLNIVEPQHQVVDTWTRKLNIRDVHPERDKLRLAELCLKGGRSSEARLHAHRQFLTLGVSQPDLDSVVPHRVLEGYLQNRPHPEKPARAV